LAGGRYMTITLIWISRDGLWYWEANIIGLGSCSLAILGSPMKNAWFSDSVTRENLKQGKADTRNVIVGYSTLISCFRIKVRSWIFTRSCLCSPVMAKGICERCWREYRAKTDEVTRGWGKLRNEELHNFYRSPNVIKVIKTRRMRGAGHVPHMGKKWHEYRVWRERHKERGVTYVVGGKI
jgi:hypothetical protein